MNALIENARNVVFDVGQVLLAFEPETYIPLILGGEAGSLTAEALFDSPLWPKLDQGVVSDEDTARDAARRAGDEALWPQALRVIRHFHEYMRPLPTWELMPRLREMGKGIYIISNYNDITFERTRAQFAKLFAQVDGMVISGEEKLLKPDPRIYRILLERYDLKAADCVFIDDRAENIAGARDVGMQGILYTGIDALL